jgi:hypothetical protein
MKILNSWLQQFLEKGSTETASGDFLVEIILLLMKCFRMRLYPTFDEIKHLLLGLMSRILKCRSDGAVFEKCLILFCRLSNLAYELQIREATQSVLAAFFRGERCEFVQKVTEKVVEMGIVNIFGTLPFRKLLTHLVEPEHLFDQVFALRKINEASQTFPNFETFQESLEYSESECLKKIDDMISSLTSNGKSRLCGLVGNNIHNTIMKTIVSCGTPFSTLYRRFQNIILLHESELSTHLYISQSLFTIWNLQWDIQNEDSQKTIADILDEFSLRCSHCDDTRPARMKPNHQNQRIFQKLSAHIYILQLLDNYIAYSTVGSFDVHANIQKCYTFLSYFCLNFPENQSVLHKHLQRLLRNLEAYPCAEGVFVIALMFEGKEVCLNEDISLVMNAMSQQMLRAKDKNAVYILLRLSHNQGNVNLSSRNIVANFIIDRKHNLFALLPLREMEVLSQKTFANYDTEALVNLEYHAAIIKLLTSHSEINDTFIEENFGSLLSLENILSLLGSSDIIFEIKLSYFNLLRKSYLCHNSYISTVINDIRLWKFVTWSWILFRGDYKSVFSEQVYLRGLITSSLRPFICKLFYQWQDNLSCFPADRQIILSNFKELLDLQYLRASNFENNPSRELRDKCRSFTERCYSGQNIEEETTQEFDTPFPKEEGESKLNHNLKVLIELHNLKSDGQIYFSEQSLNEPLRMEPGEKCTSFDTEGLLAEREGLEHNSTLHAEPEGLYQEPVEYTLNKQFQSFITGESNRLFMDVESNRTIFHQRRVDEKNRMIPYLLFDFKLTDGLMEIDSLRRALSYLEMASKRFTHLSTVQQLSEIEVVNFTLRSLRHVAQRAFGKCSKEKVTQLREKDYTKYRTYITKRKEVQDQFVTIGAVETILSLLSLRQTNIVKQSLKLLCCLLEAGNTLCQTRFFKIVVENPNPQFFSYVHSFIQNSTDLLHNKYYYWIDRTDIKALTLIFRVLQLLCEGHNNMAQNYMLRQAEKLEEFDLVNATLDLWKVMIYPEKEYRVFDLLIAQLLETMIEYCQGCMEVQNELFKRNAVECIVFIFNFDFYADNLKLLAGTLLLSLLEGPKGSPGDQVAKEICLDRSKLKAIEIQLNRTFRWLDWEWKWEWEYMDWEYIWELYFLVEISIRNGVRFLYGDFEAKRKEQSQLGSTLYCILLHLEPYIPPSYLMDELTEKSMNHYSQFFKSIEIVRSIQSRRTVERVFFPLPCSSHYLTSKVKSYTRRHINRASMKMKLEDFLSRADKLVIHIKNQKLLEKRIPLFRFVNEDVCWILAYVVIVILNAQLLSSDFSIDGLSKLYFFLWAILTLSYLLRHVTVKFKIAQYERKRRETKGQRYKQVEKDNPIELIPIFDYKDLHKIVTLLANPSSSCPTNFICKYLLKEATKLPKVKNNGFGLRVRRTAIELFLFYAENSFPKFISHVVQKLTAHILKKAKPVDIGKHENKLYPGSTVYFYLSLFCIPFTDIGFLYHIFILILVIIARSSSDLYVLFGFPLLDLVYRIDILRDILKAVAHSGILIVHVEIYATLNVCNRETACVYSAPRTCHFVSQWAVCV